MGKLADDIDRIKMNILIDQFINSNIFHHSDEHNLIKTINFTKINSSNMDKIINEIPEHDSTIFGLHHAIKPIS